MPLSVWADSPDVPGTVCFDARLRGSSTPPVNPDAHTYGQGGWDVGIHFASLSDLANKLYRGGTKLPAHVCGNLYFNCAPPLPGQITRLAINAHGTPGKVYVNGVHGVPLTADNINQFHSDLKCISMATAAGGTIYIMGCMAGRDSSGTDLLKALQTVWPFQTIVAFATVGFVHGAAMMRPGQKCSEPGMRDTQSLYASGTRQLQREYFAIWDDLTRLPWASENSVGAKIIRNGAIIQGDGL